jgi:hypothetical protein
VLHHTDATCQLLLHRLGTLSASGEGR